MYDDGDLTFDVPLQNDRSFTIHHYNIKTLSIELFKVYHNLSQTICLLTFSCFHHLRGTFSFSNQHQLFLMSLRCVFGVVHVGISIMQWHIAVGIHTFHKAPLLRRNLAFGSYSFYPVVLFLLCLAFQMFAGICTSILKTFKKSFKNVTIYFNHVGLCYLLFHGIYLLILCGDIELNPGPKDAKHLSIYHWNLNSIAAHNFAKVSALKAFNTNKKFDFICLSEPCLD